MLKVPATTDLDAAFGNIKHMPKFDDLPEDFQRGWCRNGHPYCDPVSSWFYSGAKKIENGIQIGNVQFVAKPGVDSARALRAIKAVLGSFAPKHEHKIAACGYMLSEWFDRKEQKTA